LPSIRDLHPGGHEKEIIGTVMSAIRVLDQELVNQIAAGEVIERPASVVKELLENAIDAGATNIDVEVGGSGLDLIRMADNGSGMTEVELELAILRHATSKIGRPEDLFSIRTLGFRGEALPSIMSVSRSTIASRKHGSSTGWSLTLEAGEVREKSMKGMTQGTVVEIRDLFFNTPARRKFLKAAATEQRHIIDIISRYALAYPLKRLSLSINGRTVLNLREGSTLEERVGAIWGKEVGKRLYPVSEERPELSIHGILASPEVSRPGRSGIYTYVNKRSVMDHTLRAAVLDGYRGMLMKQRFPMAVLFLDMDPAEVDVNVHPAKAEVRFKNSSAIFGMVVNTVRRTLTAQPVFQASATFSPSPAHRVEEAAMPYRTRQSRPGQGHLAAPAMSDAIRGGKAQGNLFEARSPGFAYADKAFVGVSHATYIILEDETSLYILDQHAAHERVTFERLMNARDAGREPTQTLLTPLVIELSPAEFKAFEEVAGDILQAGIEAEPFGEAAIAVRAYPGLLDGADIRGIMLDLLGAVMEGDLNRKEYRHDVIARIACHRSVRAGVRLGRDEVLGLLKDLDEVGSPMTCPHGRPLFKRIEKDEIERWIGRRP